MRIGHAMLTAATLALATGGATLTAGCGGATKTVTASEAAPATVGTGAAATHTSATATTTTATTTPPSTTTSGGAQSGTGQGTNTTRTAPEPAFTRQGTGSAEAAGAAAAVAVVKAHGYTPDDTSEYHPNQTLRVLVGTRSGSGDGYGQQAFFFVDGSYIGTDSSQPSATLRVVRQSDTEVTLAYPLYRPHDPLCCPGGGQATVRFQLDNGRLVPLDRIPPAASQTGTSRQ